MTVLDSFYILFKSDAKEAQKDNAVLDKQLDAMGDKEKKRADAEVEAHREISKQRKETTRDIRDQTDATDKLGGSFVKMVENRAQAATSFLALGAIKSGILNAVQLNSNFEITSRLTGKSVTDLRALDAAFEAAGSSAGEFKSIYLTAFNQQAAAGLDTPAPREFLDKIRAALKQAPTQKDKEQIFQRIGLPFDEAAKAFLESPDDVYAKGVASGFKDAPLKEDEAKKARDFEKQMTEVQQQLLTVYKELGNHILPYVSGALRGFGDFLQAVSGTPGGPEALAAGGGILGTLAASKFAKWFLGSGKKVVPAAVEGAAGAGAVAALAGTAALTAVIAAAIGKERTAQVGAFTDRVGGSKYNPLNWGRYAVNKSRIASLLLKGGLSQDNVNGILANLQTESGFNPQAVGDGGKAFGLAQWHPDRQANFKKLFGHDIRQSTLDEQVQFLLWELKNTHKKAGDALSGADSARSGAAFSEYFESPADGMRQAQQRALLATRIANQTLGSAAASPLNSSSSVSNTTNAGDRTANVKIDSVNVHTHATDADGMASAASDALSGHIRYAMSGMDDGRLA